MRQAKSDWLLLLDADEALDSGSVETVRTFINTTALDGAHFRVRNYTGTYHENRYSLHNALRLVRNSGKYYFTGAIHEQITCEDAAKIFEHFAPLDAVVHHYGYLSQAVEEKQKRKRNIPILEKQLEKTPGEPFALFNLGNEYLAMSDSETALEFYK